MAVHFFVPSQQEAWERIDRDLMAKRAGYSRELLDGLWENGKMGVHEMASDEGLFGYLVLTEFDLGTGKQLHVMWCEVYPCKALRSETNWLYAATAYLKRIAATNGCTEVRIAVDENHPSPSWQRRLRDVGFQPLVTQLGISVAA